MIAATILAAGDSSRMGSPKALLDWKGRTFLHTILGKLADLGLEEGYVVTGRDHDKILQNSYLRSFQVIENLEMAAGPIGSIRSVLRVISDEIDSVLLWPVDMPHVRVETVHVLMESESDRPIIAPVLNGRRGHPFLIKRQIFQEILHLPIGATARDVVRADAGRVCGVEVSDAAILESINTREEYEQAIERTND